MHSNRPFHLVTRSPWPLTGAVGVLVVVTGAVRWFHRHTITTMAKKKLYDGNILIGFLLPLFNHFQIGLAWA